MPSFIAIRSLLAPTLLAICALAACSTVAPVHTAERLAAVEFPKTPIHNTIDPGMLLEFRFFYQPELNDTQEVRADGMIALPLVGEVAVAGLTPGAAQEVIRERLLTQIANPDVTVIVRRSTPTDVLVGGEVLQPGAVPYVPRLTVLEALLRAGGPNLNLANIRNVVVIRDAGEKRHGYALDLAGELAGEAGTGFPLQPRDIVYVPRTTIANVDLWIEQHINKIVPQLGITYTTAAGNGTVGIDTAIRR